jgi:predicted DNA-binding transcriptional regulator AlpA
MKPEAWACPLCCKSRGEPYRWPSDADVTCAHCGAPVYAEDLPCCSPAISGVPLATAPRPPSQEPLSDLREELRQISTAIAELSLNLRGPPPVALPVREAAALLGCSRSQVFKYLSEGKLRRGRRLGRAVTVTVPSIRELQGEPKHPKQLASLHRRRKPSPGSVKASILALSLAAEPAARGPKP